MGQTKTKEFVEKNNFIHAEICYANSKKQLDEANWLFCNEVTLFMLDSINDGENIFPSEIIKILKDDNFCFINLFDKETKELFRIQNSFHLVKTFDNVKKNNNFISDTFLIKNDQLSKYIVKNEEVAILFDYSYLFNINDNIGKTYRQILKSKVNSNHKYFMLANNLQPSKIWENDDNLQIKNLILPEKINEDLGVTLNDIVPDDYDLYFIHATEYFNKLFELKKICNYGQCNSKIKFFDEKSGKYLFPKINIPSHAKIQSPGIYMEKIRLNPLLANYKNSLISFSHYTTIYGGICFIFPLEEIFKYHVNIKGDQNYGHGEKIDLTKYYYINKETEVVIRANSIGLDKAVAIGIFINSIELRFIYEFLPKMEKIKRNNLTFEELIKFYQKYQKEKWYIRKSNLLKVVNSYKKAKKELPNIYLFKSQLDESYKVYGTIYDTDSEDDEKLLNQI